MYLTRRELWFPAILEIATGMQCKQMNMVPDKDGFCNYLPVKK